jgi:hypothetical protein
MNPKQKSRASRAFQNEAPRRVPHNRLSLSHSLPSRDKQERSVSTPVFVPASKVTPGASTNCKDGSFFLVVSTVVVRGVAWSKAAVAATPAFGIQRLRRRHQSGSPNSEATQRATNCTLDSVLTDRHDSLHNFSNSNRGSLRRNNFCRSWSSERRRGHSALSELECAVLPVPMDRETDRRYH